jgi:hypothetical protein
MASNRMQPQHNRAIGLSHAVCATLGDYPARAGMQPNDINDLHIIVNLVLETAAISLGY